MKKILLAFSFCVFALFTWGVSSVGAVPIPQNVGNSCSLYDEKTPPPAVFGSPMHFFTDWTADPAKKTVDAFCNNGAVTAVIKKPASTLYKDFASYIYNTGYQWNEGTQTWNKFMYNCTGVNVGGVWCDADAWATPDASHPYFVAYTCSKTNNVWNCGCTDQGCAQSNWQLQQFKP